MLSNAHQKQLRTIGHGLKPIVTIAGKGLTESVCAELNRALNDHELIKVKLAIGERDIRKLVIDEVVQQTGAIAVQNIGKILLLYRANPKPKRRLSNLLR